MPECRVVCIDNNVYILATFQLLKPPTINEIILNLLFLGLSFVWQLYCKTLKDLLPPNEPLHLVFTVVTSRISTAVTETPFSCREFEKLSCDEWSLVVSLLNTSPVNIWSNHVSFIAFSHTRVPEFTTPAADTWQHLKINTIFLYFIVITVSITEQKVSYWFVCFISTYICIVTCPIVKWRLSMKNLYILVIFWTWTDKE